MAEKTKPKRELQGPIRPDSFTRADLLKAIKEVKKAIAAGNKANATAALEKSRAIIDRVVAKGVLHPNAAARHKRRLAHAIKPLP